MDRGKLKDLCLALLDEVALEHPAGHQGKLGARYVLHRPDGTRIGLLFEKAPTTPPNLWILRAAAEGLRDGDIPFRVYPASALYQRPLHPHSRPTRFADTPNC